MTYTVRPWEVGSEFHWLDWDTAKEEPTLPQPSTLFGSGRDALKGLLQYGQQERGWRRIWLPSYYCGEVVDAVHSTGITVKWYSDLPSAPDVDLASLPCEAHDVVLLVNYYGLRTINSVRGTPSSDLEYIEDHTHDPWSDWARRSHASWCFASLRKTLPVPDGAILWSPCDLPLPQPPSLSLQHGRVVQAKLAAMLLKRLFLAGHPVDKLSYRKMQVSAEAAIAKGDVSGISAVTMALLPLLPVMYWRELRRTNLETLSSRLSKLLYNKLLLDPASGCRLGLLGAVFLFDEAEQCQRIRSKLIERNIYPAVLWPLSPTHPGVDTASIEFSSRSLMLHCDMRYNHYDMERVAETLVELWADSKGE